MDSIFGKSAASYCVWSRLVHLQPVLARAHSSTPARLVLNDESSLAMSIARFLLLHWNWILIWLLVPYSPHSQAVLTEAGVVAGLMIARNKTQSKKLQRNSMRHERSLSQNILQRRDMRHKKGSRLQICLLRQTCFKLSIRIASSLEYLTGCLR